LATILRTVSNGSGSEVMRTMIRLPANNALQRTCDQRGRPALAKGWGARRGGMGIVPAAELGR
jgi:hypothetical protein